MDDLPPTPEELWDLSERQKQMCPKCGESNPKEAVMCWACFEPLGASLEAATMRRNVEQQARLDPWFEHLPLVGLILIGCSGHIRKGRWVLMGLGLAALGGYWAKNHIKDFKIELLGGRVLLGNRELGNQEDDEEDGRSPIERIADTILLYAIKDGATQVRLHAGMGVQVSCFIGEQWREQMKIPEFVWRDLRAHFLGQSDGWSKPVTFEMDGQKFEFEPHFERERELPLEKLTFSLLS